MSKKHHPAARKSKNSSSVLVAVVALIVLIILGGSRINWQTIRSYKSNAGGYEVRFPINFSLHVNQVKVQGKNEYHPVQNVIELDAPDKPKPYILISFSDNLEPQTVEDYLANTSECEAIEENPGQEIVIDGERAILYKNIACNSEGETRIYVTRGARGYSITFNEKEVDQKYLDLIVDNLSFF